MAEVSLSLLLDEWQLPGVPIEEEEKKIFDDFRDVETKDDVVKLFELLESKFSPKKDDKSRTLLSGISRTKSLLEELDVVTDRKAGAIIVTGDEDKVAELRLNRIIRQNVKR